MKRLGGVVTVAGLTLLAGVVAQRGAAANPVLRTIAVGQSPAALAIDERTGRAFVVNSGDNTVSVLDTRTATLLRTVGVGWAPLTIAVDEQAGRVFVVNASARYLATGSVSVLDATSGRLIETTAVGLTPYAIAIDQRAGRVFVLATGAGPRGLGRLSVLDAATGRLVQTFVTGRNDAPLLSAAMLAVDARTQRLFAVIGSPSGYTLDVLDSRSGARVRTVALGTRAAPYAVAVDEALGRAIVAVTGCIMRVFDAASGRPLRTYSGCAYPVPIMDRGRLFASTSDNITVLDAGTGQQVGVIPNSANLVPMALDDRAERLFALATGTSDRLGHFTAPGAIAVLDLRHGAALRRVAVGVAPRAVAVDSQAGHVLVLNTGGFLALPVTHTWDWIPAWLRGRLPWAAQGPAVRSVLSSVTVLDTSR